MEVGYTDSYDLEHRLANSWDLIMVSEKVPEVHEPVLWFFGFWIFVGKMHRLVRFIVLLSKFCDACTFWKLYY